MNSLEPELAFDLDRIRAAPQVAELEYHETTGSTNDRALERIRGGPIVTPLLILAATQTAGRGRGTNRWWSSPGALTFSRVTLPPPDFERAKWPRLALAAAVAIGEAIEELAPALRPGIRWPNDVYVAGKKVGGILVEVPAGSPSGQPHLVMGVGINVNNPLAAAPPEIVRIGTSLIDLVGRPLDLTSVLLRLLEQIELQSARLTAGDPALVDRWTEMCLLKGRRVVLRLGDRDVTGLCRGIAADGSLRLETETGPEHFFAGVLAQVD